MRRVYTEETRDQLIRNPLNDSTSKTSWSFSKGARFQTEKNICPHVAYNIDLSTNQKRKTGFGYGKRISFVLENKFTPAPRPYSVQVNVQKKGYSFGSNRQQAKSASYIPLGRLKNPAPFEYQKPLQTSKSNKGYSLRPKTAYQRTYFIDNKELKQRPGPGKYQINGTLVQMSQNNVFSKFKHLGVPNFNARTSKRFQKPDKNPGPGAYFESKQKQNDYSMSQSKSMARQTRTSFTDTAAKTSFTPGPGKYRLPTDFGHYSNLIGLQS